MTPNPRGEGSAHGVSRSCDLSAERHLCVRSRFARTLGIGQNAMAERPERPSGQRSMPRAWLGPRLR
jgi:hypothetical protein